MLPEDKWGVVIANYSQLYGNLQDYTDQLKALEKARDAKPDSPALHFLLGFHFGYLGYPKHAVKELDKTLTLAPKDFGARKTARHLRGQVARSSAAARGGRRSGQGSRKGGSPGGGSRQAKAPDAPQPTGDSELTGTPS